MESFLIRFDASLVASLLFQWINTAIMICILGKLLYNPVKKFLRERSEGIAKNISDAETALKEANAMKAEYELKLKEISSERSEILENARKIAKDNENQIIEEARKEAEVIKTRALTDIERAQDKAKDSMKAEIIEISTLIATKYVSNNIDESTQNRLFDEVIESLGDTSWQK